MISLGEARGIIERTVGALDSAPIPLRDAQGLILRDAAVAAEDLPPFDRAAMDGYAVAFDDDSPRFRVVGEVQPGVSLSTTIGRGECVRIFTGAQIPSGASQVLMQE